MGSEDQIEARALESVVHIITDAGPHPYFRTLIEGGGLSREQITVGCVGLAGPLQREMAELGVPTFALGASTRLAYPRAVVSLARMLRRLRVQVLQTHLVDGSLVGLTAARLARTPVAVMTAHHSHELPFHGRRLVWPERLCAGPLSDHIIAPTRDVAETLVRFTHVRPAKIEIVHHGFDLERLNPAAVDGRRVREELRLEGTTVLGAIGRSYRLKNYLALIDAFAAALGTVSDARLVIVGPGDARPLATRAAALGLADRVVLTGPRSDVPEVLAAFDAFVHPAVAESFGMVIVEAMAMGLPVLSTPVGIAPEVIREPESGVLTDGSDAAALERGLRRFIALRSSWPAIGASARRRVAGFTAEVMARRYRDLYEEWLSQTPDPSEGRAWTSNGLSRARKASRCRCPPPSQRS